MVRFGNEKLSDIVRHTGFPGVRYEVAAIKEDGGNGSEEYSKWHENII